MKKTNEEIVMEIYVEFVKCCKKLINMIPRENQDSAEELLIECQREVANGLQAIKGN